MEELLLIDKEEGVTSYDVIRRLKKVFPGKKLGHAGTLDPLATGLLLVGIGSGTKKLAELIGLDKTYEAEILLGISTETGDREGVVAAHGSDSSIKNTEEAVAALVGVHYISVPLYSAVKVEGKELYKYARQGIKPSRIPEKEMRVMEAEFLGRGEREFRGITFPTVHMRLMVGSGTYIRALAEEFGRILDVPAMLFSLRRTSIGSYRIEDAKTIEEIERPSPVDRGR